MTVKRWVFYNGYSELAFLCNGTDRHEIGQNNSEHFPLRAMILPQNRHFWVAMTGLRVPGLQVRRYVIRLSKLPSIY